MRYFKLWKFPLFRITSAGTFFKRFDAIVFRSALTPRQISMIEPFPNTPQKMKFSINDFFSKCDQIRCLVRIWSHLLKKSLMENFIFYAMKVSQDSLVVNYFRKKIHLDIWQCPEYVYEYNFSNVVKKRIHVKSSFCIKIDCKF